MRICPAEGILRGPWNDWLGRGPKTKKDRPWFHAGLDLYNYGKPVVAPESGRVVYAIEPVPKGASPFGGYGPGVVCIQGDSGVFHWLGHVKQICVSRNQEVSGANVVALETAFNHVHWECRQQVVPYEGQKWWPWTVTIDPYRWLLYRELTAMDAINYVKSRTTDWQDPEKRMAILRAPLTSQGHPIYPIRIKWAEDAKKSIKKRAQKQNAVFVARQDDQMIAVAAGVFAGAAILLVALKG